MKKDILTAINQARYIGAICRQRANELRDKAKKVKRSNNAVIWIKNMEKRDKLNEQAAMMDNRADKVWASVTDFQGKWINWKNNHEVNGKLYSGIIELLNGSYYHESANKYSL